MKDEAWAPSGSPRNLCERHRALRALRAFFDARGFIEVETPAVVPSPGLELHLDALEVRGFRERRYLHTSPEYHMKRLLAAGMPRIYQVCKAFRRGELGERHEPEFTLAEWYRAGAGLEQVMEDTEQLVAHVARELLGHTRLPGVRAELDVAPPWERLSVREAFARHAGANMDELLRDEERFYRTLIERVEPELGRGRPTLLVHYPASMASLARLNPADPTVAERFEAYLDGVELCNGFGELTDAAEQRARLLADQRARECAGREVYPLDTRFLAALEHGMPESGGNALGVDRLLMLLLGAREIADVVAFSSERA